ncbi:Outer membrane protein assembly factor BamB [Streptomyces sp. RB5]|uniref:Outer membrane protein assembly factor BamB n=1 Tax=Streptomyces smaragdinus TaxID=2585196 RepID=A0A7K0CS11_9ACTN|nr:PQQ-binding-like beta-propeller repeat protein [Streptomyces smaragdinus]MQY16285.1 Outer membrane protein assembly factor BamB [Streptomyces smaragdinus]
MNTDRLEDALRDTLHAWTPGTPAAPAGLADRLVRRRRRRNLGRTAGAALALTGIAVGSILTTGGGDEPPATPVSTQSTLLWRTSLPGGHWDACTTAPGAVYCRGAAYDGIGVDERTGKVVWQRKAVSPDGGSSPSGSLPGVRDGVLYTYADHAPGTSYAGTDLLAVDLDSRKVLWKHKLADDSRGTDSAVLFDGGILAGAPTYKSVTALDGTTGATLWTYDWTQADCSRIAAGGVPYLLCSPDSAKAPQVSRVIRLNPATGEPRTVATVNGPTLYLGTDGDTVLLGGIPEKGETFDAPGPAVMTRVELGSGEVSRHTVDTIPWGVVADGLVVTASKGDTAIAYSAADGERLWSRDLGLVLRKDPDDPTMREVPSAAAVDLGLRVAYFLDPAGNLVGLDLDTGEPRWRGHVRLPRGPVESGVAPELMFSGGELTGLVGGELFRIRPEPA